MTPLQRPRPLESRKPQASVAGAGPYALFHSGFAGSTRLATPADAYFHGPRQQYEVLRGVDQTVPLPHDWEHFDRHPNLGTFRIYYEGGDSGDRSARIVADEADPAKKLLRFWIGRPNVTVVWATGPERKARVQTELYGNVGLHEVSQSVRLRLHPSMAVLERHPGQVHWFTLMEYWNQPFWDDESAHPYPFRLGLSLCKPDAAVGSPLYFASHAQVKVGEQEFETVWHHVDRSTPVSFGQWMTLDTYYREGDATDGRYAVSVTPDGGARRVAIDARGYTRHPDNPAPMGLTHFNPMKLYTSAALVDFVTGHGGRVELDWADFSLWQSPGPDAT